MCMSVFIIKFEKQLEDTKDVFTEIVDALKQMAYDWQESLAEFRDIVFYVDDRTMTPRAYGRLLHKTSYICPRYNYIRSFQRSMPYHRRQH